MRASKLQSFWIITKTVFATIHYCWRTIFNAGILKCSREEVDKIARKWSKKVLSYVAVDYQVHNPNNFHFENGKQYVIMSNHSSHYDIPLIYVSLPGSIRMIAKKELKKIPFFGRAMTHSEFIFIDRNDRRQAIKDLERAKQKMKSGILLWIAPEGTRSRTGKLGPFKKGGFMLALQTGATILPVRIDGSYDVLPAKTNQFSLNQKVDVHIGQPIDASRYNINQRDMLIDEVRAAIVNA